MGKSLEELATYVMTAEEEAAYTKYVEEIKEMAPRLTFYKDEVHQIQDEKDEVSGAISRNVRIAEYTVEDDIITVTEKHSENEMKNVLSYEIYTVEIVDGKLYQKDYESSDAEKVWTVGEIYYSTAVYAEVK